MSEITLRVFEKKDAEALHRLRAQSLEECPEAYSMGLELWRSAPISAVEATIEASATGQDGPLIGAFQNETLLGFIGVKVIARKKVAHVGTLWGFYVDPEHRRKGLGQKILERTMDLVRETETLEQLRLMASTQSTAAVALFEKLGFENYGVEPRGRKINEDYHDLVYMWIKL